MNTSTVKLYCLNLANIRTYIFAALFVVGNVALPQLLHGIPQGGPTWLPIYFFTLIGAYKYGWRVGMLTALFSPLVNHALFGMPSLEMLPVLLLKSSVLALVAGFVAHKFQRVSLLLMLAVVLSYQSIGTLGEWAIVGDLRVALQDFRMGLPGMAVQVIGAYLFVKFVIKK